MKKNSLRMIVLGFILSLLFVIFLLINNRSFFFPSNSTLAFPGFNNKEINKIEIINGQTYVYIYKKNNDWYQKKDNIEFRTDDEKIIKIIDEFSKLTKDNIISNNINQSFGIEKNKITLYAKNKTYPLFIGNSSGIDNNYLKVDKQNGVFSASGFGEIFSTTDYRNLFVNFIENEEKVISINLQFDNNLVNLQKVNDAWMIENQTVKKDRVDFFLNELKTLKAKDILIRDNIKGPLTVFDFIIKIKENGVEKKAEFYKKDSENYYLITSTNNYVFELSSAYINSLNKEEKDFIE